MIVSHPHPLPNATAPAVFLDRDGTVNVEKNYLYRIADWEWIPGVPEAIGRLNAAGYRVVIVSNQAGIAHGRYGAQDVEALHGWVQGELAARGARIDAFYYCPHHPDYGSCACRKPLPAMLLHAMEALRIDPSRSWMVGDKRIDVEAGIAAGVRSLLVRTGYGRTEEASLAPGVEVMESLPEAVTYLLEQGR